MAGDVEARVTTCGTTRHSLTNGSHIELIQSGVKKLETRKAIYERHSTRWFTDEVVPLETIREITLDAGQTASWRNSQPWRIHIAHGEALDKIKQAHLDYSRTGQQGASEMGWAHNQMWDQQSHINQRGWDRQVFEAIGHDIGSFRVAQAHLFNAQTVVYLTLFKGSSPWSILDLGAFTQTLLLAATDRGIQSIHAYELVKYPSIVRQYAAIGEEQLLVTGIALGYEDTKAQINTLRTIRSTSKQIALVELETEDKHLVNAI